MSHFPVFLQLKGQPCLIVGGGGVARRRAKALLNAGARVTVLAPEIDPALLRLAGEGRLRCRQQEFEEAALDDCFLVIAATDDRALNRRIAGAAGAKKCLVNVADDPAAGTFIMPSVIDRDPVMVAVSTGGASPVLARLLRARLETLIPAGYGRLAGLIAGFRERVKARFPEIRQRRRFWEAALQGAVAELLFAGRDGEAMQLLERKLAGAANDARRTGEVYLVGGGPGDPDLLTFRALRLMQQADVVLYDRLVAPRIVELAHKDAKRIYVGKARDQHALPQREINQLLVELARQGRRVLRLKGGDPFIFGRGGEEIELLSAHDIPFQIVPGVTAASGCAAYAGIPLTHRDYAQSCLFITGHVKDGAMHLNWPALAQPQQTLAVYMGTHGIDILSRELIRHGLARTTPAAIVQQGTTRGQKIYITTLQALPDLPRRHPVRPPSMIIIGEVVRLHEKLAWFGAGTES